MDAAGLLAPLLVLATLVERIMEVIWNWSERLMVAAREAAIRHGDDQEEKDKLKRDPDYARKQLLDSEAYIEGKRVTTFIVGSLLGVVLSIFTGVRFFQLTFAVLQVGQPALMLGRIDLVLVSDMILTGMVIGAGSQPAHAIINWIYFAQSVQRELVGLRQGERKLNEALNLKETLATLGIPPEALGEVMRLMAQNGVSTLDDLFNLLRAGGARGTTETDMRSVESVNALRAYLVMTGRDDLLHLLP